MFSAKLDPLERDDVSRLEEALHSSSTDQNRWISFLFSLAVHAVCLAVLLPRVTAVVAATESAPVHRVRVIFVPPKAVQSKTSFAVLHQDGCQPISIPITLPVPRLPSQVDLSRTEIVFADDFGNELPNVVAAQHGELALLDRDDPNIARYLFQPPAFKARRTLVDVSSKLLIIMDPPQKWTVFRNAAEESGIVLDRYQAAAVFDIEYQRCLQEALLDKVGGPLLPSQRIGLARLAFRAASPCGLHVLEVSLAKSN